MGCDIHLYIERKLDDGTWECVQDDTVFSDRDYNVFAFLADVRNYGKIPPISGPRGLPVDASQDVFDLHIGWGTDAHSESHLYAEELLNFDYSQTIEYLRRTISETRVDTLTGRPYESIREIECDPGKGEKMTYTQFLDKNYFDDLYHLEEGERIVFWFDN